MIVKSMWVGPVTRVQRLVVASYLAQGHEFQLFTFAGQEVPEGVVRRDVLEYASCWWRGGRSDLLPPAQLSDVFRYVMLEAEGGTWVDMDLVCLRPFDPVPTYLFASGHDGRASCCIRCPAHTRLMALCAHEATRNPMHAGPELLGRKLTICGLTDPVRPRETFCFINWTAAPEAFQVEVADDWQHPNAWAVHLWHSRWRGGGNFAGHSIYARLLRRYGT